MQQQDKGNGALARLAAATVLAVSMQAVSLPASAQTAPAPGQSPRVERFAKPVNCAWVCCRTHPG